MDDALRQQLYLIADEMRGMASVHRRFAADVYQEERAHHLMDLAAKVAALAEDHHSKDQIKHIFSQEPWLRMSPVIGVDAFVLNPEGKLLLIQRKDTGEWAMPGGMSEIGQTLAESVLRELWEEAGLRGRVQRLLGVFDARMWAIPARVHWLGVVFQVECKDYAASPGLECLDARYFTREEVDELPLFRGHDTRVPACYDLLDADPYFDPADTYDTDLSDFQRP